MSDGIRERLERLATNDRSNLHAIRAIIAAAVDGRAVFNDVAVRYRDEYLASLGGAGSAWATDYRGHRKPLR